jgi:endonuclease/exonuclease/phosphatase family metal-dependent hydrolase
LKTIRYFLSLFVVFFLVLCVFSSQQACDLAPVLERQEEELREGLEEPRVESVEASPEPPAKEEPQETGERMLEAVADEKAEAEIEAGMPEDASTREEAPESERLPERPEEAVMPEETTGSQRIHWASLQWPPTLTLRPQQSSPPIYGQFYAPTHTDTHLHRALADARVEIGYGPMDSDPTKEPHHWVWQAQTSFHKSAGLNDHNHEYKGHLTIPQAGVYRYTYRYKIADSPWFYGDRSDYGRSGSADGVTPAQMGVAVVVQAGATFRIASYNLHCLIERPEDRLREISAVIAAEKLDFVSLQEVCRPQGTAIPDAAARLVALLAQRGESYHSFFSTTHTAQHSGQSFDEGIGFLSRIKPLEEEAWLIPPLPQPPAGVFPRKLAWARIPSSIGILSLLSTHLEFRREQAAWRLEQAKAIKEAMREPRYEANAFLLGGDFNDEPSSQTYATMTQANQPPLTPGWQDLLLGFDAGPTFHVQNPTLRIDYLFMTQPSPPPIPLRVKQAKRFLMQPVQGLYLSDHIGVLAEIEALP